MNQKLFLPIPILCAMIFQAQEAQAQPTITSADMFNRTGLYYRAYANNYDPQDISGSTAYVVPSGLIGSAGHDQFWDFSNGPTDKIARFDYVTPIGVPEAADFPEATVAERMTNDLDDSVQWLFFEQTAAGRKVYGFYALNPFFTPSNVFMPPIVDFPDTMAFGQEWSTSTAYENTLTISDPDPEGGGSSDFAQRITLTSSFKVDATGTIVLPDQMNVFGPCIRINEEVVIDVAVDLGEGQFEHLDTNYARNYYWLMPGYGIVAQLNSTQSSSPPPENFSRATSFMRMFETNKKPDGGGGCTEPQPVTGIVIRRSGNQILLTWAKPGCASQFRVEYSTGDFETWTALGEPTANLFWQGQTIVAGQQRFYRIVSLP